MNKSIFMSLIGIYHESNSFSNYNSFHSNKNYVNVCYNSFFTAHKKYKLPPTKLIETESFYISAFIKLDPLQFGNFNIRHLYDFRFRKIN